MKKMRLLNSSVLACLILMASCNEQGKESIPTSLTKEKDQAILFPVVPSNPESNLINTPIKKESKNSQRPEKQVTENFTGDVKNPTGKRIPFEELLKANISFTENKGQLERFQHFNFPGLEKVKFYSRAFCGTAYFANNGIGFGFKRNGWQNADFIANSTPKEKLTKQQRKEVIGFSIEFLGCNKNATMTGVDEQVTKINYLKGNRPEEFITDISSFKKIMYKKIYKGIDLVYYEKAGQLKYDYIVAPKAEVSQIKMNYKNVNQLSINKRGELEIGVAWGVLYDKKPYSYQLIKGVKKEVKVVYTKLDDNTIGFVIKGNYDNSKELIIDPFTIAWATYIGTATADNGYTQSTVIDNSSRVLGTGWTDNSFPIAASPNGYDKSYNNGDDAYVFRLNAGGTAMDYVTYLGGDGNETGTGIAVNSAGDICVSGHTTSFLQTTFQENSTTTLTVGLGNIIVNVAAIGSYGNPQNIMLVNGANIMYGTIYGFPNGTSLNVNVTSTVGAGTFGTWAVSIVNQAPFPTTVGSIQPSKTGNDANEDLFYLKLNGSGNNLIYGTYYGGTASNIDWAIDLALDNSDNAFITGRTQTTAGFSTAGVYKTAAQGGYDGYVLKINSGGTLGFCTYIGGAANDMGKGIAVTSTGNVMVTGLTGSTGQGTAGVFQTNLAGGDDAFLLKLTSTGTIGYFTYLGGTSMDSGGGIDLVPTNDEAVIVGTTASSDFPMKNPIDNVYTLEEGFVARFTPNGTALRYSTFIGGDGDDNIKGFDYTTVHKNGDVKIVAGKPVITMAMQSSAGSVSTFVISPVSYTAIDQSGVSFAYNGGAFNGGPLGDFFVTVLDSTAQTSQFGSFFGGAQNDYPTAGINVLQSSGCVIFGGSSHSMPFPVTPGAFETQRVNNTVNDQATIVKLCLPEILPVELLNFNVKEDNGYVTINWSTTSERDNDYFDILKSTDGINFYPIGRVKGSGTISTVSSYSFIDTQLTPGVSYYRLKQVDINDQFKFSDIRTISIQAMGAFTILPNPGNGLIKFRSNFTTEALVEIRIQNVLEEQIYSSKDNVAKGAYEKEINLMNAASGLYLIQIKAGGELYTVKYVKE